MDRRTGTRLVKTMITAIARLRAGPSEMFCFSSLYTDGGDIGPPTNSPSFSICALVAGKWHGLGGFGTEWDIMVVGQGSFQYRSHTSSWGTIELQVGQTFAVCKNILSNEKAWKVGGRVLLYDLVDWVQTQISALTIRSVG